MARGKRRAAARRRRRGFAPNYGGAARDRGTVLLMVLGVLALMAIIAVVYASIGRGDRISSAMAVRQQRISDQVDEFAQYFTDVLRRDVHATYTQEDERPVQTALGSPGGSLRLEGFDAPFTDVMMLSQALNPQDQTQYPVDNDQLWRQRQSTGYYRFDPAGTYSQYYRDLAALSAPGATPAKRRDPRSPSDPYLASTEPVFRNRPALPGQQPWGNLQTYDPYEDYLNLRDWRHISNFAPSGNFVNLWALRNNFRAEPGFQVDGNNKPRLSSLLTLINPMTGFPYRVPAANQDPNTNITGQMRAGNMTSFVQLNRPSDWCTDQIGLFRTLAELPTGTGTGTSPYGVDDPEYMPYLFADADGDGFYDSRWFELVDIFDAQNLRPIVNGNGRARLFVAARCVDLSALVNVNTASDFQFEPKRYFVASRPPTGGDEADPLRSIDRPLTLRDGGGRPVYGPRQTGAAEPADWLDYRFSLENSVVFPAGLTPADVDLQRLFRLSDSYYAFADGGRGVGYRDLPQPPAGAGLTTLAGDYRAYDPSTNPPANETIGNAAYQALWDARIATAQLDNRYIVRPDRRYVTPDRIDMNLPPNTPPFADTLRVAQNRFRYYENFANRPEPGTLRLETGRIHNRFGETFDESDELELRTFQGLNDPANLSRLEATVAGRTANEPTFYSLSPLRDDRSDALERAGRDLPPRDLNNTRPGVNDEYRRALLAWQIDIRRLLTTISGARPIIDDQPVTVKVNSRGDIIQTSPTELSEAAGTLKLDMSRIISRICETGNFSFDRFPNNTSDIPQSSSPCDFIDDSTNPPTLLANIERENLLDDLGWFEPRPDNEKRPWFYASLDNLAPPTGLYVNQQAPGPSTGSADRGANQPDEENFEYSRLDLTRELFRAYAGCLLPYSQWGTDSTQTAQRNGPFPRAWDRDPALNNQAIQPNLHYGGDPELALRSAAHMTINLRDAADSDRAVYSRLVRFDPQANPSAPRTLEYRDSNLSTALTLDLTIGAMDRTTARIPTANAPYPNSPLLSNGDALDQRAWYSASSPIDSYQRDLNYPWPKLNLDNRFDTTDDETARTRLAPIPQSIVSTGDPDNAAAKRVNIFGIEPQPFISQVSSIMIVADTPYFDDTDPRSGDKDDCDPPPPGSPVVSQEVTIKVERSVADSTSGSTSNPDFICYLIAFQLTNPFDTDIVLEPENPTENYSWYYLEYANRYYRLAPKDSAQPVDGLKRLIPDAQRILRAGQTKTFYATYPNSLKQISERIRDQNLAANRAFSATLLQGSEPNDENEMMGEIETTFARIAKHEFGEDCVNVAPMYPETSIAIGAKRSQNLNEARDTSHRLTNVDLFAIDQSHTPNAAKLDQDGDFGENRGDPCNPSARPLADLPEISFDSWTTANVSQIKSDPRRRVYLWRVLRDPDSVDGDARRLPPVLQNPSAGSVAAEMRRRWNWTGNDQLLDRLYDPSPIPYVAGLGDPDPLYTSDEREDLKRCANGALIQALVKPFDKRLDRFGSNNSSTIAVPGTVNCPPPPNTGLSEDNRGLTMVSCVSISRTMNPPRPPAGAAGSDPVGRAPEGAMPPWCMEAKPDNVYTPGVVPLTSAVADRPGPELRRNWSLNVVRKYTGVQSGSAYARRTSESNVPYYQQFQDFLDAHSKPYVADARDTKPSVADSSYSEYRNGYPAGNNKCILPRFIDAEFSVRFADRRGAKALPRYLQSGSNASERAFRGDPRQTHNIVDVDLARSEPNAETAEFYAGSNAPPRRFDQVAIELHTLPSDTTDSTEAQSTPSRALFSRVGDFLLPLAVGPTFDPAAGPNANLATHLVGQTDTDGFYRRTAERDNQWTTLAEVLALASDYYSGPEERTLVPASGTVFQSGNSGNLDCRPQTQYTQRNIYYRYARDTRGYTPNNVQPLVPKGDRGHLVLDAWTPYLDYNPRNDDYQWARLDLDVPSTISANRDSPLGNGIPLALNILDKFRVSGVPGETQAKPSDSRLCIDATANPPRPLRAVGNGFARAGRRTASGSASQLVPGLININTAPLSVLRLLPMVSPSRDLLANTTQPYGDSWLYDSVIGRTSLVTKLDLADEFTANNSPNPPIPNYPADPNWAPRLWDPDSVASDPDPWDFATTIAAWRDQSAMFTRAYNGADGILIDFRDSRMDVLTNPPRSGRDDALQINTEAKSQGGLRDQPGFKSPGELMALEIKRSTDENIIRRAANANRPANRPIDDRNSVTRLAHDSASNKSLAIDSSSHKIKQADAVLGDRPWGGTDPKNPIPDESTIFANIPVAEGSDTIADDYDEKLSIANAILNTVTVRSDVFCIWFIINGFTPEDCQVDDGFPLVPSIAKRYVMVVDRSSVTTPTAKPKIVMLREVPMP